jgi:hypothetical protein
MCIVSDNLKLCTCKTKDVAQLKHYWIIKRRNARTSSIVGQIILPAYIGKNADKLNEKTILKQLNEGNIFDVELQHEENDLLELYFTVNPDMTEYLNTLPCNGDYLAYAFKFKKGRWKKSNYDPYEVDFDEVEKGKIVKPFSNR